MTATRSWWQRQRFLLLRRSVQLGLLGAFLLGPLFGVWWVKGNLASSKWFEIVPLSDPYIGLQALAARQTLGAEALTGAAIILVAYLLIGGRVYCSWVCPINLITDFAAWCRDKLQIPPGWRPSRQYRRWILVMTLVVSGVTGSIAWELVNPITMVHRALVFGLGLAWLIIIGVFVFDLLVSRRGWCGHLCPVGAFYGLLGHFSGLRVSAVKRDACTDCGDCFRVCPEPQVIAPALHGTGAQTPMIVSGDCTNCGRCIDVCDDDVFRVVTRLKRSPPEA